MCPACIATAAWIAVGTVSTGGISALVVGRLRGRKQEATIHENHLEGERYEKEQRNPEQFED